MRFQWFPILCVLSFIGMLTSAIADAPAPRSEQVHFEKGTTGSKRVDKISGAEKVDYVLGAITGQTMKVNLTADNPDTHFNILRPEASASDDALFDGAKGNNNSFSGPLPRDGNYIIEVYLASDAAGRNEVSNFTLDIAIDPVDSKLNAAAKSGPASLPATTSVTDSTTKAVSDTAAAATTTATDATNAATDAANSASKAASDAVDATTKTVSDAATATTTAVTDAADATAKAASDAADATSKAASDAAADASKSLNSVNPGP